MALPGRLPVWTVVSASWQPWPDLREPPRWRCGCHSPTVPVGTRASRLPW